MGQSRKVKYTETVENELITHPDVGFLIQQDNKYLRAWAISNNFATSRERIMRFWMAFKQFKTLGLTEGRIQQTVRLKERYLDERQKNVKRMIEFNRDQRFCRAAFDSYNKEVNEFLN